MTESGAFPSVRPLQERTTGDDFFFTFHSAILHDAFAMDIVVRESLVNGTNSRRLSRCVRDADTIFNTRRRGLFTFNGRVDDTKIAFARKR